MRVLVLAVLLAALPAAAPAQMVCDDRATVVKKLLEGYAEKPLSVGLAMNGSMIEVFVSPAGTFSIVITKPGGSSCLVAAGDNWGASQPPGLEI